MKIRNAILASTITLTGFFGLHSLGHAANDLTLINAATNEPIGEPITTVGNFRFSNDINFRFNDAPESNTQSVRFVVTNMNGTVLSDRVENQQPFSAFGDNNGNYNGFNALRDGATEIFVEVQAYSEKFAQGSIVGGSTYTAIFENTFQLYQNGVYLVDATTNATMAVASNGASYSIADIGSNLNIDSRYGFLGDQVGSVQFERILLGGEEVEGVVTENIAPYALFGDSNGNFNGRELTPGSYGFEVRAFSGPNGTGEVLNRFQWIFNLTE